MGIFGGGGFGGSGFQGPGEEFGNSWDSFKTGKGNLMTDSEGNKSNVYGEWDSGGPGSDLVTSGVGSLVTPKKLVNAITAVAGQQGQGSAPKTSIWGNVIKGAAVGGLPGAIIGGLTGAVKNSGGIAGAWEKLTGGLTGGGASGGGQTAWPDKVGVSGDEPPSTVEAPWQADDGSTGWPAWADTKGFTDLPPYNDRSQYVPWGGTQPWPPAADPLTDPGTQPDPGVVPPYSPPPLTPYPTIAPGTVQPLTPYPTLPQNAASQHSMGSVGLSNPYSMSMGPLGQGTLGTLGLPSLMQPTQPPYGV